MDKIKDMMHGGHKKEGEQAHHTTPTGAGYGQPTTTTGAGYGQPTTTTGAGYGEPMTTTEGTGEKKHGLFGLGGHKKEGREKHGSSSSSSSDEEREGARERNRIRRERRAQRQAGATGGTTTVPMTQEGTTGDKKHGFFG